MATVTNKEKYYNGVGKIRMSSKTPRGSGKNSPAREGLFTFTPQEEIQGKMTSRKKQKIGNDVTTNFSKRKMAEIIESAGKYKKQSLCHVLRQEPWHRETSSEDSSSSSFHNHRSKFDHHH